MWSGKIDQDKGISVPASDNNNYSESYWFRESSSSGSCWCHLPYLAIAWETQFWFLFRVLPIDYLFHIYSINFVRRKIISGLHLIPGLLFYDQDFMHWLPAFFFFFFFFFFCFANARAIVALVIHFHLVISIFPRFLKFNKQADSRTSAFRSSNCFTFSCFAGVWLREAPHRGLPICAFSSRNIQFCFKMCLSKCSSRFSTNSKFETFISGYVRRKDKDQGLIEKIYKINMKHIYGNLNQLHKTWRGYIYMQSDSPPLMDG